MKRLFSIMLALALLITMPGMLQCAFSDTVKAADAAASGDFTSGNYVGQNLAFIDNSTQSAEAYTYKVSKAGVSGRLIPNNKYAYFKAENNAVTESDHDLFVEITYYDEGNDFFQLQYNAISTNYKQATINKSNSLTWVTTTVCLEDAAFKKAQNGGCDFRIWGRGNSGTAISKIKLTKQSVNPDLEPLGKRTGGTANSEFIGKSFTGYQGWFGTGGQYNAWQHYAYGDADADGTNWPRPGKISIDYFPDITEYADSSLAQTGFANLGNGNPTKLFDSNTKDVIDTHFGWMNDYGIDGAAIQRFVGGLTGRTITSTQEATQLKKIQNAAEANNRLMYVMYDISGGSQITDTSDTTSISSYVKDIKFDWVYNIEQSLEMLNSPAYTTVNGKPVVCVWGFGFDNAENTRPSRRVDYEEIIDFFHNRGCYVIIGVPRDWRTQSQYIDIYKKADMISPWYVGALGADTGSVDSIYNNYLSPDVDYCNSNGMDYYPVVFSGFSWTLWQGGKPNMIPRNAGQTFWNQAYRLKKLGLNSIYVAMFDEYDEGTAVAKNASDYFDIPTDQYFVTASCDGYWLSSDFQLRVVREAIKMMKGQRSLVSNVPVAHSNGPIYYRNSFEKKYVNCLESQHNGDYPVDPCFKNAKTLSSGNANGNATVTKNSAAKTGDYVAAFSGTANGNNSSYVHQISETAIKVTKGMKLSYSLYAVNSAGKNTYVDLLLDDGSYVSTKGISTNGIAMGAGSAKGNVGSWSDYTFTFGSDSIVGKSIVGVALSYGGNAGSYSAYFDNIIIENGDGAVEETTAAPVVETTTAEPVTEAPTAAEKKCDLVVTDIYTDKTYKAGEEASFIVTVKNIGEGASPSGIKHGLALSVDGSLVNWCDTYFDSIDAGATATLVMNWGPNDKSTWTVESGSHTVSAMIDDQSLIAESDETNNRFSRTMTFGEVVTEAPTEAPITTNVELTINGYQISTTAEGFRTIYSIKDANKEAVEAGLIYGLTNHVSEQDMVVGTDNQYVFANKATENGKNPFKLTDDINTTSYTMTMQFGNSTVSFFNSNISVRAYAKLANGKYVYSNIKTVTIYDIAEALYQNRRMNTYSAHNYLYEKILNAVTPGYKKVDYDWSDIIVKVN